MIDYRDIVSWLLILLAAIDVMVTTVLVRASRRLHEPALEERATVSMVLTFGGLSAAALGAAHLIGVDLPVELSIALFLTVLVVMSAPQLVWYVAFRLGRFQ